MIAAGHERAQPPTGPAFADAVTFAFGDPAAQLYGLARLGLSPGGDGGAPVGSALAVLFAGRDPVTALARGGLEVAGEGDWTRMRVGALATSVTAPLHSWQLSLDHDGHGFELGFEALGPPGELSPAVAAAGGMAGYEQPCAVRGTVRTGGRVHEVRCLGQRGHAWGEPDWTRIDAVRTVCAWPEEGPALALTAVRPAGVSDHAAEPMSAALLDEHGPLEIHDPRLSTTYDGAGHQRRAGLELWVGADDEYPRNGSGQVLCGSTVELGQLTLDCAFFRWSLDGRPAIGRYDVLRRA